MIPLIPLNRHILCIDMYFHHVGHFMAIFVMFGCMDLPCNLCWILTGVLRMYLFTCIQFSVSVYNKTSTAKYKMVAVSTKCTKR